LEGSVSPNYARSNAITGCRLERQPQTIPEFQAAVHGKPNRAAPHSNNPFPRTQAVQKSASQGAAEVVLPLGPIPAQARNSVLAADFQLKI
jgi:hypothetical protein